MLVGKLSVPIVAKQYFPKLNISLNTTHHNDVWQFILYNLLMSDKYLDGYNIDIKITSIFLPCASFSTAFHTSTAYRATHFGKDFHQNLGRS